MPSEQEFQSFAAQCQAMADNAENEKAKSDWQNLADKWLREAEIVRRNPNGAHAIFRHDQKHSNQRSESWKNTATYRVVSRGHGWAIDHDGKVLGNYATKEGAFEAIIGAASNSIKDGYGISIQIPPSQSNQSPLGAE